MCGDLPNVDITLPWLGRVAMIAVGIAVIWLPVNELARVLWPPNLLSLLAGIIILGAAFIGLLCMFAGIFGEAQRWSYPPRTVVIQHRRWLGQWQTRFMARDIAAVEIRHRTDSEAPDTWRVALVPVVNKKTAVGGSRFRHVRTAFETRDFATQEKAEIAGQALRAHLEMSREVAR